MSPADPPPTGCAYPAVALTCGYHYYEGDAFIPPPNSPELVIPTPKSTGCGALIHASAALTMAHTWRAPAADVTSNVIPLEAHYFDLGAATLLRLGALAECGCVMDGVGCQLCGNALGARFSPCAAHTPAAFGYKYTFLPNAVWPCPCSTSSSSSNSSSAPPSPASSNSHPHQDAHIQSPVERYAALVRTAFPPQRRLDAQSLGVPRDFARLRTPSVYTDTDVFEGYEEVYGAAEPARGVREASAPPGASGNGSSREGGAVR
ncbi:hypothetical protein B0H11DRAFT_1910062 [Mycena galericulata]|nr:hypothetical protein B0H11DRAFT_1910062 [Mycena galericulata]